MDHGNMEGKENEQTFLKVIKWKTIGFLKFFYTISLGSRWFEGVLQDIKRREWTREIDWVIDLLIDWLIDWVIDWSIDASNEQYSQDDHVEDRVPLPERRQEQQQQPLRWVSTPPEISNKRGKLRRRNFFLSSKIFIMYKIGLLTKSLFL